MKRIRFFQFLLFVVLIVLFIFGSSLLWIQSNVGAGAVSLWMTTQVARKFPATRVTLRKVRLHWADSVELQDLQWARIDGVPILILDKISVCPVHFGNLSWKIQGNVQRLDLAGLDQLLEKGHWKAQGFVEGVLGCEVKGLALGKISCELNTRKPGGNVSGEVIERLLRFMPEGANRKMLLRALQRKPLFHFDSGQLSVIMEDDACRFHLFLDGDHLLEITLRIPRESVTLLENFL